MRSKLLCALLLAFVLVVGCGGGAPGNATAPTPTAPAPTIAVPTITQPTIVQPTIDAPTIDATAPAVNAPVPDISFPEIRFPRIQLPEITIPGVVVQQGDSGGHRTTVYTVPADVLFDFDKADIRPDADEALRQISASLAKRAPGAPLEIRGHTDSQGGDAYNMDLSRRRADAVKAWLTGTAHMDPATMAVRAFGERQPVAPNTHPDGSDDPVGRQRNRRVEIVATA